MQKRTRRDLDAYILRELRKFLGLPKRPRFEPSEELRREEEEDEKWNRLSMEEIRAEYQDAV